MRRKKPCAHAASIVAQDLVSAEMGASMPNLTGSLERTQVTKVTIGDDNPLAVYQMSGYNAVVYVLNLHTFGSPR